MSPFKLLVAGLLALSACAVSPGIGTVDQSIIGGTTAQPSDYPTVVELEGQPTAFECTGTLIDPSWVMTAAHCFEQLTATTGHIRIDGNNMLTNPTGTVIGIKSVHVDPQWTGATNWTWTHDMSLVELKTPITNHPPTRLYLDAVTPGTTVITVGYGNSDNMNGGAGILRQLTTPTMDCAATTDPLMKNENVMCFDGRDNTSSCYGDSGGPAFLDVGGVRTIAGETSGGTLQTQACTGANAFYAYTEVSAELAFIQQYVPGAIANGVHAGGGGGSGSGGEGGGSGSGSDTGSGSGSGSGSSGVAGSDEITGGCHAGGGSPGLLISVLGLTLVWRRRTR
ncbi:MAG: putative secreted protein [Myxococcales bacterium]|nr:putative secreted protein [Myxococcales bacterium]